MPFGLPLRTRNTIVDVYGALLFGRNLIQPGVIRPAFRDRLDVVGERERDDIGFEAVDHRARLSARARVRLAKRDFLSTGFRRPVFGERFVERAIQLSGGIVGDVQERGLRLSGQGTTEHQSRHEQKRTRSGFIIDS